MRARRKASISLMFQQTFEFLNCIGFQYMLNRIRVSVYLAWCNICMRDQIQFPEAVLMRETHGLGEAGLG